MTSEADCPICQKHAGEGPLAVLGEQPLLQATFPLADAAKAHAHLEAGAHLGKIVLTVK